MRAAVHITGAIVLGPVGALSILFGVAALLTLIDGETEYVDWFLVLITLIAVALGVVSLRRARAAFRARAG